MGTWCAAVCQNPKPYPYPWYPFWKHRGYHGYGYGFGFWHTAAHHVPIPQCCRYSTGKLQWVILTICYFYSHFLPFPPLFFWYCKGFGVVAILGMLSHKYHYFLILAVQLLRYSILFSSAPTAYFL